MKNIVFAAVALMVSGSAFAACPDLAGRYVCNIQGEVRHSIVEQATVDGVTTYTITENDTQWAPLIVDGVEHDFSEFQGMPDAKYTANCVDSELIVDAHGHIVDNGQAIGELTLNIHASKDSSGNLLQSVSGMLTGDFGEYPIEPQSNTCTAE